MAVSYCKANSLRSCNIKVAKITGELCKSLITMELMGKCNTIINQDDKQSKFE